MSRRYYSKKNLYGTSLVFFVIFMGANFFSEEIPTYDDLDFVTGTAESVTISSRHGTTYSSIRLAQPHTVFGYGYSNVEHVKVRARLQNVSEGDLIETKVQKSSSLGKETYRVWELAINGSNRLSYKELVDRVEADSEWISWAAISMSIFFLVLGLIRSWFWN